MSDLVKIVVTVLVAGGLIALAYSWYGSSLTTGGGRSGQFAPQYAPVYMPRMR
jgi:hypothetical protein